jgi:two-component system CheB/CheR fusion protein
LRQEVHAESRGDHSLDPTGFRPPHQAFATALIDTDLAEDSHQILQDLGMKEQEVRSKEGAFFRMRIRPYRTVNNVIDGVVITFEDITALKETQAALKKLNAKLEQRKRR